MDNKPSASARKNSSINYTKTLNLNRNRSKVFNKEINRSSDAGKKTYPLEMGESSRHVSSKILQTLPPEIIQSSTPRSVKVEEINSDEDDENNQTKDTQDFVRLFGTTSFTRTRIIQGSIKNPGLRRNIITVTDQKSLVLRSKGNVFKQNRHTSFVYSHRLENKRKPCKKVSSKPSPERESENKRKSSTCDVFNHSNLVHSSQVNKGNSTRNPLKTIQDRCGNTKDNIISIPKRNCLDLSKNKNQKESQNVIANFNFLFDMLKKNHKSTDDSSVTTEESLVDTSKRDTHTNSSINTSNDSQFSLETYSKNEISLNETNTTDDKFLAIHSRDDDDSESEDGNYPDDKSTKLTDDRNCKGTEKNAQNSSIRISSALLNENRLFKQPCQRINENKSLTCNAFNNNFNLVRSNQANKENNPQHSLKTIQDRCGENNIISNTKWNCREFKSIKKDRKDSQKVIDNFDFLFNMLKKNQDHKRTDDSSVKTEHSPVDTSKLVTHISSDTNISNDSQFNNFNAYGKNEISLNEINTPDNYLKLLATNRKDDGETEDGNLCTKLKSDKNCERTGKNAQNSTIRMGFSGLEGERADNFFVTTEQNLVNINKTGPDTSTNNNLQNNLKVKDKTIPPNKTYTVDDYLNFLTNCSFDESKAEERNEQNNFKSDRNLVAVNKTGPDTKTRVDVQNNLKDKHEKISLNKIHTADDYLKFLSIYNTDEGNTEERNENNNIQFDNKCDKLRDDRNCKGNGKNSQNSSVRIGFSGLLNETELVKKSVITTRKQPNDFRYVQEEPSDSLFYAKMFYKPIPQKPTLKSIDNLQQIDSRTDVKSTQGNETSKTIEKTNFRKLRCTDSSDEESAKIAFKNFICKKRIGMSSDLRQMQGQSENKSNKNLESMSSGKKYGGRNFSQYSIINRCTDSGLSSPRNKFGILDRFNSGQSNIATPRKDSNMENNPVIIDNSEDMNLTCCIFLPDLESSNFLPQSNKPHDVYMEMEDNTDNQSFDFLKKSRIHDTNNISDPKSHPPCRKPNLNEHEKPEMLVNKEVSLCLKHNDFLQKFHVEEFEEDRIFIADMAKDNNHDISDLDYNIAHTEEQDSSKIDFIISSQAKNTEQFRDNKSCNLLFPQPTRKSHLDQESEADEEMFSQLFNMDDLNAIINDIDKSLRLTSTLTSNNLFKLNTCSSSACSTRCDAGKIIKRYNKKNVKIFKILYQKRKYKLKKMKSRIKQKRCYRMLEKLSQVESSNLYNTSENETDLDTTRPSSCFTAETRSELALSTGSAEGLSRPQKSLRQGVNFASKNKSLLYDPTDGNLHHKADKYEVIRKIRGVFMKVYEDISRKVPPTLEFRRHSLDNCIFKDNRLQLKPEMKSKMSQMRPKRLYLVLYLLKRIFDLLKNDKIITKRELYYEIKTIIKQSCLVYGTLNMVTSLLDVGPWSLNICCQKGLVSGDLRIYFSSGDVLDCKTRGVLIPQDLSEIEQIRSNAYFILVVEKEAIFNKLLQDDLPNKLTRPFIMITGKGFPDLGTQIFLRKLWMILSIPVFILVDGDPHGINIMLTYRYGSMNNAHISQHLAVPKAQWLGILPSEMASLAEETEELTDRERKLIKKLLISPYIDGNKKIAEELKILLKRGVKVGIEGLIKNESFLSNNYLPTKFFNQHYI